MTDDEIRKLAREVVNETLHRIGLNADDPDTVSDVADLKALLGAWRSTKRTVHNTITRVITLGVLGALALGAAMQIRGGGGGE